MSEDAAWAWAVGLFEGEGYVGLCSTAKKADGTYYRYPRLAVQITDEDVLRRYCSIVGGKIRGPYQNKTPSDKPAKPSWYWQARCQDALRIAIRFYPLLGTRRAAKCREVFGEKLGGSSTEKSGE